jgi:hypothetical protein
MSDQETMESQLSRTLSQLREQAEENVGTSIATLMDLQPQLNIGISGLYKWTQSLKVPPQPGRPIPVEPRKPTEAQMALFPFMSEELSLDVDGRYPLLVASGTISRFLAARVHWVANLQPGPALHQWQGTIWFKDGDAASFPYTNVDIEVVSSLFPSQRRATATFSGGGAVQRQRVFKYASSYHHPVEFEFDCTADAKPVLEIQTYAHPNHPASLPNEALSIPKVYMRAGFNVKTSPNPSIIPLSGAGADGKWSDMEMHDAMQVYWSRFANKSQWALWTFFAALHEQGTSLGGIMFDDIGPNHRQGTAIFTESFISQPPANDPDPQAWINRMKFWTACHEMGHAFNLAHSWQKSLGTSWIPLANEPEARSFMNYPYNVAGGQTTFFSNFEFRFSDAELLFMRHAPERFVEMGNANWFDHHGFEQANVSQEPTFKLEARINRAKPEFEFLEPVVLDLKLSNLTTQPQIVHERVLSMLDHMTIVIKKHGQEARTFHPYAQYCWQPQSRVLDAGQSTYESLFISAGANGWDIAEPGYYTVQIALHLEGEDIISNALRLRIAPPRSYEEEYIAQDYFSDDVGRILRFDGSRHLLKGIDTLQEASERLADRRVALHSKIALGNAISREFRSLDLSGTSATLKSASDAGANLRLLKADVPAGRAMLADALTSNPNLAAETLSHIDYHYYSDSFSDMLADQGMPAEAAKVQDELFNTLARRNVKPQVLDSIKAKQASYEAGQE